MPVPQEAVGEYRVSTAGYSAGEGHGSGAQVNVLVKSGSNNFHGSVFAFNRNTLYNANDFFDKRQGASRPVLLRNQFGGSLGGPIRRGKTFIFGTAEWQRQIAQSIENRIVYTPSVRNGIFRYNKLGTNSSTLVDGNGSLVVNPSTIGDRQLIHRARHLRRLILRHTPNNNQRTLALFIAHGHYEQLLTRYRLSLASRARQITESLRHHLPGWRFREPHGGSALWVETLQHYDTFAIELQARKRGVLIESGASFFRSANPPRNSARLAYSTIAPELIDPGVRALALTVREQQRLPKLA
jgi:hypothetical protein